MVEIKEIFEKKINFVDAENNLITCEIEIKQTDKGPEFTMSGSYDSCCGQIFGHIKPRIEAHKKLIELWEKYHLNGMNAGTEEQEKLLKRCKSKEYDDRIKFLKNHRKYTVTLKNGTKYKYGTSWLYRPLPENFKNKLINLIENIELDNIKYKEDKIKQSAIKKFDEFENEIIALAKHLDITPQEAEDIEYISNNRYKYQGIEYLIGTEEEINQIAIDYLTDDTYLWKEAVEHNHITVGLEEWAEEVINIDGYGHILNSWDGTEDTIEVNGIWYYIIRQ